MPAFIEFVSWPTKSLWMLMRFCTEPKAAAALIASSSIVSMFVSDSAWFDVTSIVDMRANPPEPAFLNWPVTLVSVVPLLVKVSTPGEALSKSTTRPSIPRASILLLRPTAIRSGIVLLPLSVSLRLTV